MWSVRHTGQQRESTCYRIEGIGSEFLIGPVMDVDVDVAQRAFETNFFAPVRLAQLFIPYVAEQGGRACREHGVHRGQRVSPRVPASPLK